MAQLDCGELFVVIGGQKFDPKELSFRSFKVGDKVFAWDDDKSKYTKGVLIDYYLNQDKPFIVTNEIGEISKFRFAIGCYDENS